MSNFFTSLLLAAIIGFAAPVILIGGMLGFLGFCSYLPGLFELSSQGTVDILDFLAIFGSGKYLQGAITLGLTFSTVGILLEILNFYRYQSLRDKDYS
ncbi:MAG: hypothetical protein AAFQ80_17970 [Cyanobacteria bacterium J06621_8]